MTLAGTRPTNTERDEARVANRGGFSFLLVHGITWTVAGALSFSLPLEQAALVYLFQGLVAFPASLMLERLLGLRLIPTSENAVVELFVLVAMTQGFALPASIIVLNLDPLYLPAVFAASNGGHFLAYTWLHRTRAYAILAAVTSLGPFAIILLTDARTSFHATGFLVGAVMLATGAYVLARNRGSRPRAADATRHLPGATGS